jgi:ribonuclease BN (tRNA processing enzyme)
MKIRFLGTGSAFTTKGFQTNMLIEENEKRLLLDAGSDIRFSLKEVGLSFRDIDSVYISHLHADHAGGMEYLGFCTFFTPGCPKINLYGNGELLRKGWDNTWKGGMESYQGKILSLESFFEVNMIRPNGTFTWQGIDFAIIQSIHFYNGYSIVPCYGLMAFQGGKKVYFTTDTQYCPAQIMDFYKSADLIINDCETYSFKSGVHANYLDLRDLPKEIKAKMVLVHTNDNIYGEDGKILDEWVQKAKADGFIGFGEKGQVIEF